MEQLDKQWDEIHDPEIVDWKRVRLAIEHENTLTNYRLMWFLLSQTLLFTAFTSVSQVSIKDNEAPVIHDLGLVVSVLIWIIPSIGIVICVYLAMHLHAGTAQHERLYQWWNNKYGNSLRHPKICGGRSLPIRIFAIYMFPFVFAMGWLSILFRDSLIFSLTKLGSML